MSEENDKKVTICVVALDSDQQSFFEPLLKKALSDKKELESKVEIVCNRSFSDVCRETEGTMGTSLRERCDDVVAGRAEEGDYQEVINLIGELVAEAVDEFPEPPYVVCPDMEYGSVLGLHQNFFDINLLLIDKALAGYYEAKTKEQNYSVKKFGVIGDYGVTSSLAKDGEDFNDSPGRHLPYSEYEELFSRIKDAEKDERKDLEDAFVSLVKQLDATYRLYDEKIIMIGNLASERFLWSYDPEDSGHPLLDFIPARNRMDESFWDRYEAVWQERVKHLYGRPDWPSGLKLHSLLTDYAMRIMQLIELH